MTNTKRTLLSLDYPFSFVSGLPLHFCLWITPSLLSLDYPFSFVSGLPLQFCLWITPSLLSLDYPFISQQLTWGYLLYKKKKMISGLFSYLCLNYLTHYRIRMIESSSKQGHGWTWTFNNITQRFFWYSKHIGRFPCIDRTIIFGIPLITLTNTYNGYKEIIHKLINTIQYSQTCLVWHSKGH
jgi:hypothetical protein